MHVDSDSSVCGAKTRVHSDTRTLMRKGWSEGIGRQEMVASMTRKGGEVSLMEKDDEVQGDDTPAVGR